MFSVSKTHTNTVQFNTFAPTHEKCHVGEIELLDLGARQLSPSREIAPLGLTTTSTALTFWALRLLPSVVPTCVSLVRPPPSMNWQRRSTDSVGYASSSSSTRTFWAPIPAGRREGDKEREREREIRHHHPLRQYCLNNSTCLFASELNEKLEQTETNGETIERKRQREQWSIRSVSLWFCCSSEMSVINVCLSHSSCFCQTGRSTLLMSSRPFETRL